MNILHVFYIYILINIFVYVVFSFQKTVKKPICTMAPFLFDNLIIVTTYTFHLAKAYMGSITYKLKPANR